MSAMNFYANQVLMDADMDFSTIDADQPPLQEETVPVPSPFVSVAGLALVGLLLWAPGAVAASRPIVKQTRSHADTPVDMSAEQATSTCRWSHTLARLTALSAYGSGWDGAHAERIPLATLRAAERVVQLLEPRIDAEPSVVPTPDGGVQLEWHTMKGDVEIHILSPDTVDVFTTDAFGRTRDLLELPTDAVETAVASIFPLV